MDYLKEVKRRLDLSPEDKDQVMGELGSHYTELVEELLSAGRSEPEARQEATRRMGDPKELALRMQSVHCRASHRTALLTALPFFAMGLATLVMPILPGSVHASGRGDIVSIALAATLALGLLFIGGSIRELYADRRPVWLTTWIPAGIYLTFMNVVAVHHHVESGARGDVGAGIAGVPAITTMMLLGVLIYRRSPGLILPVLLLGLIGIAALLHRLIGLSSTNLGAYAAFIIGLLLLFAVALGLPRFGRSELLTQPPLLISSFYAFPLLFREFVFGGHIHLLSVGGLLLGLIYYHAARSSTWMLKLMWVTLGLAIANLAFSLAYTGPDMIQMVRMLLFSLMLLIVVPLVLASVSLALGKLRFAHPTQE